MGKCKYCGVESRLTSRNLGLCGSCAREPEAAHIALEAHQWSIESFGLRSPTGEDTRCTHCVNSCGMANREKGRCGLRACEDCQAQSVFQGEALVDWYYDPLPTNCVAEWMCDGGSEEHHGHRNLAVFFHGCTFDCLFCQNWHHREGVSSLRPRRHVADLVGLVDDSTYCVCFFGGDPTPQIEFAFQCCEQLVERPRPPCLCWETNGSMASSLADKVADYSARSLGYVKFDLKAFDDVLHAALCGSSNTNTLRNFERLGKSSFYGGISHLLASTLLIPGYVEAEEVSRIASFIASVNDSIPYSLLAFHPDYLMDDLPPTSVRQARECVAAATASGLKKVHLGNVHLLV